MVKKERRFEEVEWRKLLKKELLSPVWRKLPSRTREILELRFGVGGASPASLQAVGDQWKITRERVRQIIVRTGEMLKIKPRSPLGRVQYLLRRHLRRHGSVMVEEKMYASLGLREGDRQARGVLRTVLFLDKKVGFCLHRKGFRTYWYLSPASPAFVRRICREAREIFRRRGKPLTLKGLAEVFRKRGREIGEVELDAVLSADSLIGRSPFGRWGLAEWPSICPRLTADKVYLVLEHLGRPVHFEELTEEIKRVHFDERMPVAGTVHNELMRDERFVRVGRGTYALAEWVKHADS